MTSHQQIEILCEEPSMKFFLEGLLPRIIPEGFVLNENVFVRAFEGKQDLKKKLPKRLRAFNRFRSPVSVIVIHDQDSSDCMELKQDLTTLIQQHTQLPFLIRIACRELEAFYFAEMSCLQKVYPNFQPKKYQNKRKYRVPDAIESPGRELRHLIPSFSKTKAARLLGPLLDLQNSSSPSFYHLHTGIRRFLSETT